MHKDAQRWTKIQRCTPGQAGRFMNQLPLLKFSASQCFTTALLSVCCVWPESNKSTASPFFVRFSSVNFRQPFESKGYVQLTNSRAIFVGKAREGFSTRMSVQFFCRSRNRRCCREKNAGETQRLEPSHSPNWALKLGPREDFGALHSGCSSASLLSELASKFAAFYYFEGEENLSPPPFSLLSPSLSISLSTAVFKSALANR